MVLRCPRCSELTFFGRTQVLGEVVVCPECAEVFGWRDASGTTPAGSATGLKTGDKNRLKSKP
jgi:hypothetical protein